MKYLFALLIMLCAGSLYAQEDSVSYVESEYEESGTTKSPMITKKVHPKKHIIRLARKMFQGKKAIPMNPLMSSASTGKNGKRWSETMTIQKLNPGRKRKGLKNRIR
jgi:hypothetical protein